MSSATLAAPRPRQTSEPTKHPGIARYHARDCERQARGRCTCKPTYQASVYSARERKKIRKHFDSEKAARQWRAASSGAVEDGTMRAPTATTIRQAAKVLIDGMEDGSILDRSGKPYKPSTTRSYECSLRLRVLPAIGHLKLSALSRDDVQAIVDRWRAGGLQ